MDRLPHHSPVSRGSAPPQRPARTCVQHSDKSSPSIEWVCLRRGTIMETWTRNPARLLSRSSLRITEHFCDIWSVESVTARSQKTSCKTRLRRPSCHMSRHRRMKAWSRGSIATFETPPLIVSAARRSCTCVRSIRARVRHAGHARRGVGGGDLRLRVRARGDLEAGMCRGTRSD